jgi:glutamate racemase
VLREIRRELPAEDLIYVADSAHAPYGDRDAGFIISRAVALFAFLLGKGAKAVVVASNTVTGVAVDALRARYQIPIVAIEPAVKPAAAITHSRIVGVLATTQTLASPRFARLVEAHASGIQVVTQGCPGLVEQVESGELASRETESLVRRYVEPLVAKGADTIVLGCTHYPFLADAIGEAAGAGVTIVDPAVAVARELRRRLQAVDLLAPDGAAQGTTVFLTTGDAERMRRVIGQLGLPDGTVSHLREDETSPALD